MSGGYKPGVGSAAHYANTALLCLVLGAVFLTVGAVLAVTLLLP